MICREYGLNHMRFHSWCPPEAAFEAADRLGIYIQAEANIWVDGWMAADNAAQMGLPVSGGSMLVVFLLVGGPALYIVLSSL